MATKEAELQSQETEPQELGATPEVPQEPVATEPGAEATPVEAKPAPKPRLYTEDEWRKRESEKDKESAALRQKLAEVNMQAQIAEAQRFERENARKDRDAVAQGTLTEEDAREREQIRRDKVQVYLEKQRVMGAQEEIAKTRVAQEIAKKYGVSVDDLLGDREIRSPADMIEKAAGLSHVKLSSRLEELEAKLKALQDGEPKYDQGQKGSRSEDDGYRSRYPTMFRK